MRRRSGGARSGGGGKTRKRRAKKKKKTEIEKKNEKKKTQNHVRPHPPSPPLPPSLTPLFVSVPTAPHHIPTIIPMPASPPTPTGTGTGTGPGPGPSKNSVALRAMRSVRSLARIGSWAQLRAAAAADEAGRPPGDGGAGEADNARVKMKAKAKVKVDGGRKRKENGEKGKEKKGRKPSGSAAYPGPEREREEEEEQKYRYKYEREREEEQEWRGDRSSGSSFEVGRLSPAAHSENGNEKEKEKEKRPGKERERGEKKGLGRKKGSMGSLLVGLGLAGAFGGGKTERGVSTASASSSVGADDSRVWEGDRWSGSVRRVSSSGSSEASHGAGSVRWDEEGLEREGERRRRERAGGKDREREVKTKERESESKRAAEGRKRTPLNAVFPGAPADNDNDGAVLSLDSPQSSPRRGRDLGADGQTTRVRPASEDMLGRAKGRPQGVYYKEEGGTGMSLPLPSPSSAPDSD